jgi:hypothetical protein
MTPKNTSPDQITAETVADWMLAELEKQDGVLYQSDAASQIAEVFGAQFIYESDSTGHDCIAKPVLAAFRKLSGDSVVWNRGDRFWRRRELDDEPGRQQNN